MRHGGLQDGPETKPRHENGLQALCNETEALLALFVYFPVGCRYESSKVKSRTPGKRDE
jgi:hypothetical protein